MKTSSIKEVLPRVEAETNEIELMRDQLLNKIGNIVDPSVVVDSNEDKNEVRISVDYIHSINI